MSQQVRECCLVRTGVQAVGVPPPEDARHCGFVEDLLYCVAVGVVEGGEEAGLQGHLIDAQGQCERHEVVLHVPSGAGIDL